MSAKVGPLLEAAVAILRANAPGDASFLVAAMGSEEVEGRLPIVVQMPNRRPEQGERWFSLQYQARLEEPSRAARRELLHREFQRIAADLVHQGTEVDLNSLSISGQTVEAVVPLREYDHLVNDLGRRQVRVDALLDRQVVTTP